MLHPTDRRVVKDIGLKKMAIEAEVSVVVENVTTQALRLGASPEEIADILLELGVVRDITR